MFIILVHDVCVEFGNYQCDYKTQNNPQISGIYSIYEEANDEISNVISNLQHLEICDRNDRYLRNNDEILLCNKDNKRICMMIEIVEITNKLMDCFISNE